MYSSKQPIAEINLIEEYSPSMYTQRFKDSKNPSKAVVEHFIRKGKLDTSEAIKSCQVHRDIRYGKDHKDNQLLDIYFRDRKNCCPIFVYIHGGYWTSLDKSSSGSVVLPLVDLGYQVICVDYNLCPTVDLKTLTQQIHNLFEWIHSYAIATQAPEVNLCGHSAGAHLACELFRFSSSSKGLQISNVFLISGLYDLRELWRLECCNHHNILGLNETTAFELSPICWLENLDVDFLQFLSNLRISIIVAEFDSETFREQSRSLMERLLTLMGICKKIEFSVLSGYDHFDIIEEMSNTSSSVSAYIRNRLNL